jgi:hypothetical protein
MKIYATRMLAAALMLFSVSAAMGQDDHAYTEGPVVNVAYIRTEPGKFDEYLRYLAGTYKALMEEQKKAGIIQDYAVYAANPRTPQEPDLILTVTYKNMAALDGLDAKVDPLVKKLFSSLGQADQASAERGKLRTQLGAEFVRKLELK